MIQKSKDKLILLGHLHVGQIPLANRGIKGLLFVLIAMVSAVLPLKANETFSYTYEGTTLNYKVSSENTCIIVPGNENISGNIVIPSIAKYDDKEYNVTGIGKDAFRNCIELASVTIPNSVTKINSYVFENCKNLSSITIPNSLDIIYHGTFRNCSSLKSIIIPSSVTLIYHNAFEGCTGLKNLIIEDSNTKLSFPQIFTNKRYIFEGCPLESIYLGRDLYYNFLDWYPKSPFSDKENLIELTIGNYVTQIGDYAFCRCRALSSVTIPNSVKKIGDYAFCNCRALSSVIIPNSVEEIGDYAFARGGLKSITISKSIKPSGVGQYVFSDSSLVSVYYGADNLSVVDGNIFNDKTYKDATLYLSQEGIKKANSKYPWMKFKHIKTYNFNSHIEDVISDFDSEKPYEVYDLNGLKVSDSKENLPKGIYILQQGKMTKKITVL